MEFTPRRLSEVEDQPPAASPRDSLGTVLVVSREQLWAVALRRLLEEETGMPVGVLAPKGSRELVRELNAASPTMVVLDCRQGGSEASASVELVARAKPAAAVIMVVGADALETSVAGLRAGAVGVLGSDASHDDLHAAVEAVRQGELFLSQAILREFVDVVTDAVHRERTKSQGLAASLSPRESDVLERLTRGMSNAEIARSLNLSEATVKLHLAKIMTKWGVRDRVQVVIKALGGDCQND